MGLSKFGPGGLRVVFNEDPDTPCMVYLRDGSATFECACCEGEVEGYQLSDKQLDFLNTLSDKAHEHYSKFRKAQ